MISYFFLLIFVSFVEGGFAMAAMMIEPPKTAFAVFLKPDGTVSSNQRLFSGEVFNCNVFMDPKAREVYFVYQIAQWATTVTHGRHSKLKSYPYFIVATKTNATGGLLTLNEPSVVRYLVGFTREKNANIAGYMNQNNAW